MPRWILCRVCRNAHHGDPTLALSADEIARNPSFTQGIETLFGMADQIHLHFNWSCRSQRNGFESCGGDAQHREIILAAGGHHLFHHEQASIEKAHRQGLMGRLIDDMVVGHQQVVCNEKAAGRCHMPAGASVAFVNTTDDRNRLLNLTQRALGGFGKHHFGGGFGFQGGDQLAHAGR